MDLKRALRLQRSTRLALVGSGGKTSALFALARQYDPPVVLTTTTHLSEDEAAADAVWRVNGAAMLPSAEKLQQNGISLLIGPPTDEWRVSGLEGETLQRLKELADEIDAPLLIEADGSRRLPLKAPAPYEPSIPDFVNMVAVLTGLSGVNKPLNNEWVHRPETFAVLSGLQPGEAVTPEALARVLCHPMGGKKHIPTGAEVRLLLNQADNEERQAVGATLARLALPAYDSVVIAQLQADEGNSTGRVYAAFEHIGGVVLAAGGGARYGGTKQLLEWRGEPFVRAVTRKALEAGLEPVTVVTGADGEAVWAAVADLPVRRAHNSEWPSGMGSSVRAGINSMPKQTGACIFLLADMPQVEVNLLRSLVEEQRHSGATIIAPMVEDRRTNPTLFDRDTFAALGELHGDTGGREIFAKFDVHYLPWHDTTLLLDVDTQADFQRLKEEEE